MKKSFGIVAITLASSLVLLTVGCDKNKDPATTTSEEKYDNSAAATKQNANDLGNTLERKADQAGQAIDDAAITTSVKSKYLADDLLKGLDISVETDHGVVMLTGAVQNDSARERATQIAQGTDGVVSVNNSLSVK
ncbi:MAG: BON domain-containing protein [Sulfuriferula multivorans]|uniref:Osmotically-inducible protein Y n=1 Tax=Sulfuriferula multivorans TaxID=1559896 RepID=A0A7C9NTI0_9PROT|nr:BON domain-containing protein [Sulfuriferula multivorans]